MSARSLIAVGLFRNVVTLLLTVELQSSTDGDTGVMWIKITPRDGKPRGPIEVSFREGYVSVGGVEQLLNHAEDIIDADQFWGAVAHQEGAVADTAPDDDAGEARADDA